MGFAEQVLPFGTQNPVGAGAVPAGGSGKWAKLEEIRSGGAALEVEVGGRLVTPDGVPASRPEQALKVEAADVLRTVQLMGEFLYTLEEELKEGFITLRAGTGWGWPANVWSTGEHCSG